MGIVEKIEKPVVNWVFGVALKKGIMKVVQLLVAWLSAKGISFVFTVCGQSFASDVNGLTALFLFLLEIIRNYLKIKFPKFFGWM